MLTFRDKGLSRRGFLRVGGLPIAGMMGLPQWLAAQDATAGGFGTGKSVVFLFMQGGPSQIETFDPKMDRPDGNRSAVGEVATSIPGVTFGATFPKLARLAKQMSVVRSFTTGTGAHDIKPIVDKSTAGASLGSYYSRFVGSNREDTGLPTNVTLYPGAVIPDAKAPIKKFGDLESTGPLGGAYAPFAIGAGGEAESGGNATGDMELVMPRARLDDRRHLLGELNQLRRKMDRVGGIGDFDRFQQQAFDVVFGGVSDAFDLSQEDPRTIARYDTAPLFDVSKIDKRWNNRQLYSDHMRSIGKQMLMARRLVERGCGFVTVSTGFVWDMHADKNNATMEEGLGYVGAPFDHAVSAFIEDIYERGLSENVLLVCCGEMGRNPKMNAKGGRDHWGKIAPLMLSGGGLNMGQVIGESSRDGGEPKSDPYGNSDLVATIMNTLLDLPKLRTEAGISKEIADVVFGGRVIRGLM